MLVSTGGGDWTHPRGDRRPGRGRLPGHRHQAVRQPVDGRHRDVHDGDATTTRSEGRGCSTWRCRSRRRASPSTTTGTPSACAAPPATTWCSTTCSCPTSGCWPTGRTAWSTRRCRSSRSVAMPIISAVYLGVAEAACAAAVEAARRRADDPTVRRQVGLMRHRLQVAAWALDGVLDLVGADPSRPMRRLRGRDDGQARGRPGRASRSATWPWTWPAARPSSVARWSSGATATSGPRRSTRPRPRTTLLLAGDQALSSGEAPS